jgi:hypothetical protein
MQLAQVNVARLVAPMDDPRTRGFAEALEPVNALAEASPGFVWRLQDEGGDATAIQVFDDPMIIVNLSVWESLESLGAFVYRSGHADYLRRRREWFHKMDEAYTTLWWVPAGHEPSPLEARERLEHLRAHGPTEQAFTFRVPFPAPGGEPGPSEPAADWMCPA